MDPSWSDFIRLQGGYFSEYIDVEPDEEKLETDAGLTNVRILEFDLLNYVNFEADIHFAEDEGIVQVNKRTILLYGKIGVQNLQNSAGDGEREKMWGLGENSAEGEEK